MRAMILCGFEHSRPKHFIVDTSILQYFFLSMHLQVKQIRMVHEFAKNVKR